MPYLKMFFLLRIINAMPKLATIKELQNRIAFYEDMDAYKHLYYLLFDGLYRFSYSLVKSKETAEEIVSDVFIKVWQIRSKLNDINNLKVYLYTITKNFSLNYITKISKNPVVSLDTIDVESLVDIITPQELCISSEIINKIRQAIQNLPPQCRLIFKLVKDDGLKYKEAAVVLNISVVTVRNQMAIATKKIAQALPAKFQSVIYTTNSFSVS